MYEILGGRPSSSSGARMTEGPCPCFSPPFTRHGFNCHKINGKAVVCLVCILATDVCWCLVLDFIGLLVIIVSRDQGKHRNHMPGLIRQDIILSRGTAIQPNEGYEQGGPGGDHRNWTRVRFRGRLPRMPLYEATRETGADQHHVPGDDISTKERDIKHLVICHGPILYSADKPRTITISLW